MQIFGAKGTHYLHIKNWKTPNPGKSNLEKETGQSYPPTGTAWWERNASEERDCISNTAQRGNLEAYKFHLSKRLWNKYLQMLQSLHWKGQIYSMHIKSTGRIPVSLTSKYHKNIARQEVSIENTTQILTDAIFTMENTLLIWFVTVTAGYYLKSRVVDQNSIPMT